MLWLQGGREQVATAWQTTSGGLMLATVVYWNSGFSVKAAVKVQAEDGGAAVSQLSMSFG